MLEVSQQLRCDQTEMKHIGGTRIDKVTAERSHLPTELRNPRAFVQLVRGPDNVACSSQRRV